MQIILEGLKSYQVLALTCTAILSACLHGKGAYVGILPEPFPFTPAARFTAAPPAAPSVPGSAVAGGSLRARQILGFMLKQ